MSQLPSDRLACFSILFPGKEAMALAEAPWSQIRAALADETHLLLHKWPGWERRRLEALVRLCELYVPNPNREPDRILDLGDVVARMTPRCRGLSDRVVWLLCLDESRSVEHEVLVQMGGDRVSPPPVRQILRHALFKGAASLYVVDFRAIGHIESDAATERSLADLTEVGVRAGVQVRDWILFGQQGVVSVHRSTDGRKAA